MMHHSVTPRASVWISYTALCVFWMEMPKVAHVRIDKSKWHHSPPLAYKAVCLIVPMNMFPRLILRGTDRAFHIKSGGNHFHLCHIFIIPCHAFFLLLLFLPLLPRKCQNNTFWHLLYFIYINLLCHSPESRRDSESGESRVIVWWVWCDL